MTALDDLTVEQATSVLHGLFSTAQGRISGTIDPEDVTYIAGRTLGLAAGVRALLDPTTEPLAARDLIAHFQVKGSNGAGYHVEDDTLAPPMSAERRVTWVQSFLDDVWAAQESPDTTPDINAGARGLRSGYAMSTAALILGTGMPSLASRAVITDLVARGTRRSDLVIPDVLRAP